MPVSELFRKIRKSVGETTQSRVVVGSSEIDCPIEASTPMVQFLRAMLEDAEQATLKRHSFLGVNVYTGMNLESLTLIGSSYAKPLKLYTDGKFNVGPMFPELAGDKAGLGKIEKMGFTKATYVGWITREQGDNPVYIIQTPMKAPEVRAKLKGLELGYDLVPVFDSSFRDR